MKRVMLGLCLLAVAIGGCSGDGVNSNPITAEGTEDPFLALARISGNNGLPGRANVLRLVGTGEAYGALVPDIDGDGEADSATCFDVDLYNANGMKIGTAPDCLSEITPSGDGLALVGTTIFRLPNGTFMSRGSTTVQPVTTSSPTPVTHITGAIPMEGSNGVIQGTGAYTGLRAQVRLSGAVNMSQLNSDNLLTFDCLFAITP